jgi:hypothetical protein
MREKTIDINRLRNLVPDIRRISAVAQDGRYSGSPFVLEEDGGWSTHRAHGEFSRSRDDIILTTQLGELRVVRPSLTKRDDKSESGISIRLELVGNQPNRDVKLQRFTFVRVPEGTWSKILFPDGYDYGGGGGAEYLLPLMVRGHKVDVFLLRQQRDGYERLVLEFPDGCSAESATEIGGAIRLLLTFLTGVSFRGPSVDVAVGPGQEEATSVTWHASSHLGDRFFYHPIPASYHEWSYARRTPGLLDGSHPLNPVVIGRCVEKLLERHALVTPIEYLTRFQEAPVEMRGAFISIALEALTSDLEKQGLLTSVAPLSSVDWMSLRTNLCAVLDDHAQRSGWTSDSVGPVRARIDDLNRPTNAQKLTRPFDIMNISLSKEEIYAIRMRNKLLHTGRLLNPDLVSTHSQAWREAYQVEMHLLTAVYKLTLRYIGYTGAMIDWGATSIETGEQSYLVV